VPKIGGRSCHWWIARQRDEPGGILTQAHHGCRECRCWQPAFTVLSAENGAHFTAFCPGANAQTKTFTDFQYFFRFRPYRSCPNEFGFDVNTAC
jgi:hypothetical protein